ncbi:YgiT-type zinc finger protein [Paenibacillus medicaginis]|uniref:YgiT-type zinc finger protein n=1 Tax=Paenibacillus medicaginis TaxID=1470560 RepID=A0ABV5C4K9_9BACL
MSVKACVMCGSTNLKKVDIDYPLESDSVKSLKIPATKCCHCGEEYINGREVKVIEQIVKTLNEQAVGA